MRHIRRWFLAAKWRRFAKFVRINATSSDVAPEAVRSFSLEYPIAPLRSPFLFSTNSIPEVPLSPDFAVDLPLRSRPQGAAVRLVHRVRNPLHRWDPDFVDHFFCDYFLPPTDLLASVPVTIDAVARFGLQAPLHFRCQPPPLGFLDDTLATTVRSILLNHAVAVLLSNIGGRPRRPRAERSRRELPTDTDNLTAVTGEEEDSGRRTIYIPNASDLVSAGEEEESVHSVVVGEPQKGQQIVDSSEARSFDDEDVGPPNYLGQCGPQVTQQRNGSAMESADEGEEFASRKRRQRAAGQNRARKGRRRARPKRQRKGNAVNPADDEGDDSSPRPSTIRQSLAPATEQQSGDSSAPQKSVGGGPSDVKDAEEEITRSEPVIQTDAETIHEGSTLSAGGEEDFARSLSEHDDDLLCSPPGNRRLPSDDQEDLNPPHQPPTYRQQAGGDARIAREEEEEEEEEERGGWNGNREPPARPGNQDGRQARETTREEEAGLDFTELLDAREAEPPEARGWDPPTEFLDMVNLALNGTIAAVAVSTPWHVMHELKYRKRRKVCGHHRRPHSRPSFPGPK
jgi:hypothetical protein